MTRERRSFGSLNNAGRLAWPAELIALGFHLLMIWSVVAAMQKVEPTNRVGVLGILATAGLIFGFILARTAIQDLFAHSIAVWAGAVASFVIVSVKIGGVADVVETRARVLRNLVSDVVSSISTIDSGPVADEQLLVVLGITSWLLAYSSAWVVYRRRWFTAGIGVPAAIMLASLHVDDRNGGWELIVFLIGAIGLAARDSFAAFMQRWLRRGLSIPKGAATWFMASAVPIAVVTAIVTVTATPLIRDVHELHVAGRFADIVDAMLEPAVDRFGQQNEASSYADFPDEWDISDDGPLGDELVVVVSSLRSPYLTARSYDTYTGKGWKTNVQETFASEDDPDQPITMVTFTPGTTVQLTDDVSASRSIRRATVRVIVPTGGLAFGPGQFASSETAVQTVMGWLQIESLTVDTAEPPAATVPIELRHMLELVSRGAFSVDPANGQVSFLDPALTKEVNAELERLLQFPVSVSLADNGNGGLQVTFNGRVPNYDDIETVFHEDEVETGDAYTINAWESSASAEDLARAGTEYPDWVVERYLGVPDTVSEQTRAKADELQSGLADPNPYNIAALVEAYLHSDEFTYVEEPPALPSGADMVDEFLFDTRQGRCQQYASTMAVLLRILDIPTRVVTGYSPSQQQNQSGDWMYRAFQAHAWVEVFFPGYGWYPFEPTPGRPGFGDVPEETTEPPVEATPTPESTPIEDATPEIAPSATVEASPVPPAVATAESDEGNLGTFVAVLLGIGFALIASVGTYLTISWNRGLRGLRPASGYFARLIKLGGWFGLEPGASTTPGEYARSFSRTVPGTEGAVRSITDAYYEEQFNPAGGDRRTLAAAEAGWKTLRRNLLRWRIRPPA